MIVERGIEMRPVGPCECCREYVFGGWGGIRLRGCSRDWRSGMTSIVVAEGRMIMGTNGSTELCIVVSISAAPVSIKGREVLLANRNSVCLAQNADFKFLVDGVEQVIIGSVAVRDAYQVAWCRIQKRASKLSK
jgi:hypothetical protein